MRRHAERHGEGGAAVTGRDCDQMGINGLGRMSKRIQRLALISQRKELRSRYTQMSKVGVVSRCWSWSGSFKIYSLPR